MPFADPRSTLLDEMARRRAEAEALRAQMMQASQMGIDALEKGGEAQRVAQESALRQKQQAVENARAEADFALRQKVDERAGAESALRQKREAAEADRAAQRFTTQQQESEQTFALRGAEGAREAGEQRRADYKRKIAGAMARGVDIDDTFYSEDFGPDEVAQIVDEIKQEGAARAADLAAKQRRGQGGGGMGAERREIELERARLALEKARREASGEPPPGRMPKVPEAQAVASIDMAIKQMQRTGKKAEQIDTGPIANMRNWFAQRVGVADPDVVQFKSMVGEQVAQYVKGISGATVPVEERRALMENVPSMSDNDGAFQAKLERVIETLEMWKERELRALQAAGVRTDAFPSSGAAAPVAPALAQGATIPDDGNW